MNSQLKEYFPFYKDLLNNNICNHEGQICTFFHQAGKKFSNTNDRRILFVGKANNGWITDCRDVDFLFKLSNPDRIVNRDDEMEWIEKQYGEHEKKFYNTKKSAFYRLMKNISVSLLEKSDWYHYVAWTNLYKIAPWEGGNPNNRLKKMQVNTCIKILEKEFELLNPSIIIFLTSGWENKFLKNSIYKNNKKNFQQWGKYKTYYDVISSKLLIYSHHPQGKDERSHSKAIKDIVYSVSK